MGKRDEPYYRVEIIVSRRDPNEASYETGTVITAAEFGAATLGGVTDAVRLVSGAVECDLQSYGASLPRRIEWDGADEETPGYDVAQDEEGADRA